MDNISECRPKEIKLRHYMEGENNVDNDIMKKKYYYCNYAITIIIT
jgi:hypothetical protein